MRTFFMFEMQLLRGHLVAFGAMLHTQRCALRRDVCLRHVADIITQLRRQPKYNFDEVKINGIANITAKQFHRKVMRHFAI